MSEHTPHPAHVAKVVALVQNYKHKGLLSSEIKGLFLRVYKVSLDLPPPLNLKGWLIRWPGITYVDDKSQPRYFFV